MRIFINVLQRFVIFGVLVAVAGPAFCAAGDAAKSKDHPLLSRYPDSRISEYTKNYNAVEFATGAKNSKRQSIEGDATFIRYFYNNAVKQPSPLQLIRNYQNAIKSIGGEVAYERLPADSDGGETTLKVTTG